MISLKYPPRTPGELLDDIARIALGTAYALKSRRIGGLPAMWRMLARHYLDISRDPMALPDPAMALNQPDGLVGICSRLEPELVVSAYRAGLHHFAHIGPKKWWAPPQRMVLFFDRFHIEKNLARLLRNGKYTVTFNTAFEDVMRGCAAARPGRWHLTWITRDVMDVYKRLHAMGYAHSVEAWDQEGNLAGGLYGVAYGRVFTTESQFTRQRDASKVAFATLNRHLQAWNFAINDCMHWSAHLEQMGCELIERDMFAHIVRRYGGMHNDWRDWRLDGELDTGTWNPAEAEGLARTTILARLLGQIVDDNEMETVSEGNGQPRKEDPARLISIA